MLAGCELFQLCHFLLIHFSFGLREKRAGARDWKQREQMYRITQTGLEVCFSTLDSSTVSVKQTVALICPSWLHPIIPVSCRKKLFFQNVRKSRKEHDSFKPARYSLKPKGQIVFSTQVLWVEKSSKSKKLLTNFLNCFFWVTFLHAPPIFHSSSLFFYRLPNFPAFSSMQLFIAYSSYPIAFLCVYSSSFPTAFPILVCLFFCPPFWKVPTCDCSYFCFAVTTVRKKEKQITFKRAHLKFTPWCETWVANLMATNLGYSRYVSGKVESFRNRHSRRPNPLLSKTSLALLWKSKYLYLMPGHALKWGNCWVINKNHQLQRKE